MTDDFNVVIDTKKLDALIAKSPEMVDKAIVATAFDVAGLAAEFAPLQTGALKASIFVKTHSSNGFSAAESAASGMNPEAEIHDPTPDTPPLMTAYVAPGMNYAAYQEFGTSRMPAHPFLTPAVETADDFFIYEIKKIFDEVIGG